MHEKRSKIDFFANFQKLQKKLPICKKRYAEILRTGGAIVRNVEKKVKSIVRIFFGSTFGVPGCSSILHKMFKFQLASKIREMLFLASVVIIICLINVTVNTTNL